MAADRTNADTPPLEAAYALLPRRRNRRTRPVALDRYSPSHGLFDGTVS